ncbi:DNA-3-methyladenine glycosylase I [Dongia sp.]|uniref:DNA-3-methyladenine glycosylase I n=1 Tax=Dongia sp. TaxID=1977262 RepID=UPI003751EADE
MKLRSFEKIFELAAERKGGAASLSRILAETRPRPPRAVAGLGDDRVLAAMTRTVFAGGFGWHIIDGKWPGFEAAFGGFDPHTCAFLNDDQLDALMRDRRIIRSPQKITGVPKNARFVLDLAAEHGSAARFFAPWPDESVIDLIAIIRQRGVGFGFENAARFLRAIGKPAFINSPDVLAALVREGVLERPSSGKKALAQIQAALNHWSRESGHDLTTLSRVLAMSGGRLPPPQRGYLSRM